MPLTTTPIESSPLRAPAAPAPAQDAAEPAAAESSETTADTSSTATDSKPADAQQPAAKVEAKPADAKPADERKPDLEREREQRDVQARLELKKRGADLDAREAKVKLAEADALELAQLREAKRFAKEDPLSFVESAGLTVEQIFKAAKEGKRSDPTTRKALIEAEALRKRLDERDASEKKAKEDAAAAENATKLRGSIGALLKSEGDRFELTQANGAQGVEAVHEALLAYHSKFGRAPSIEEAKKISDNVEKFYRAQADKYAESNYFKGRKAPVAAKTEVKPADGGLDNEADAAPRSHRKTTEPVSAPQNYRAGLAADWEEVKRERAAREAAEASRG